MQLWKKTYLVTVIIMTLILNAGMYLIISMSFQNNYRQAVQSTANTAMGMSYTYLELYNTSRNNRPLKELCAQYSRSGNLTSVSFVSKGAPETQITSNLPVIIGAKWKSGVWEERTGEKVYLAAQDMKDVEGGALCVTYVKDITSIYKENIYHIYGASAIVLLILLVLCIFFYLSMQHIYKPVSNIAHELRTPLTNIQGYAQYIRTGSLKEEDVHFASGIIEKEVRNLNAVVERLLIMGNVREGMIHKEKINLNEIMEELKLKYAGIEVLTSMPGIVGDASLITCMFGNLAANGIKASGSVRISAEGDTVYVVNEGIIEDTRVINALNKNKKLPPEAVKGNGYGIALCHEIAKLHQAKLQFAVSERNETVVSVTFP